MKFLNIHDVLFILVVTLLVHVVARPVYNAIDSATGNPSPNAS